MDNKFFNEIAQYSNIVLLGEAGCGKSELAVNLSLSLRETGKEVHLFDLDMTKPLFRSRDEQQTIERSGVHLHFTQQFADAPTITGGVVRALKNADSYTVLDVGGDYIGARAIGGYAPHLNRDDAVVYYIINPFRPWSQEADSAAGVFSQILAVCHIKPEKIRFIGNPNMGMETTLDDVLHGYERLCELVEQDSLACVCVRNDLFTPASAHIDIPVYPIERYIAYPWQ